MLYVIISNGLNNGYCVNRWLNGGDGHWTVDRCDNNNASIFQCSSIQRIRAINEVSGTHFITSSLNDWWRLDGNFWSSIRENLFRNYFLFILELHILVRLSASDLIWLIHLMEYEYYSNEYNFEVFFFLLSFSVYLSLCSIFLFVRCVARIDQKYKYIPRPMT